ncbi:MAG: alpha/beta fold hydrolase [Methylomonas sp.]
MVPFAARHFSKSTAALTSLPYAFCLCLTLLIQGCATPSEKYLDTAAQLGLSNQLLAGMPYQHRLFVNEQANRANPIEELHVYLDGDGTPWQNGTYIAGDPTPRNPLVLQMMAKDTAPAVLLGRPCYYGLSMSPLCNASLWTSHRYAVEVIASMDAAIQRWMSTKTVNKLVLIGFSGGGSLATLLTSRLNNVATIITIAANLDVEAWSNHHNFLPLTASLNPIHDAHIPAEVHQFHLAGLEDRNVPPAIVESFSRTQKNAVFLPVPEYDHSCCWLEAWPEILETRLAR